MDDFKIQQQPSTFVFSSLQPFANIMFRDKSALGKTILILVWFIFYRSKLHVCGGQRAINQIVSTIGQGSQCFYSSYFMCEGRINHKFDFLLLYLTVQLSRSLFMKKLAGVKTVEINLLPLSFANNKMRLQFWSALFST